MSVFKYDRGSRLPSFNKVLFEQNYLLLTSQQMQVFIYLWWIQWECWFEDQKIVDPPCYLAYTENFVHRNVL